MNIQVPWILWELLFSLFGVFVFFVSLIAWFFYPWHWEISVFLHLFAHMGFRFTSDFSNDNWIWLNSSKFTLSSLELKRQKVLVFPPRCYTLENERGKVHLKSSPVWVYHTLRETNSSHLPGCFRPSIIRRENVSFREVNHQRS